MMLITLPVSVLSHAEYSLPVMPLFGILLATFPISIFPLTHRIFTLKTYAGPITILPPEYIDEVRNDIRLSLAAWFAHEFSVHYAGFEVFRPGTTGDDIVQDTVTMGLSGVLGNLTPKMADDVGIHLEEVWGSESGWQNVPLNASIDCIVERVFASVIFGLDLDSQENWLGSVKTCLETGATALGRLQMWPPPLRPLVHWLLPSCWRLRDQVHNIRGIVEAAIAARVSSDTQQKYDDAIEWMERSAKGRPYDTAMSPMVLFLVGTSTTGDMLTQVLSDLCARPELVEELRQEVMDVRQGQNKWRGQDLHRLRLMDSVLKESQRLKPFEFVMLRRIARETARLSDGTQIPKGSSMGFSTDLMWDVSHYPDPNRFYAHRFLYLRDTPGYIHKSQLASPSASHLGFGYGLQSCPGRLFAVASMKIILAHIVIKYDIRASGDGVKLVNYGFRVKADPKAGIFAHKRQGVTVP